MRTKREIEDMHNIVHCLFESLEFDDEEGKLKDNTEEEEMDKGTLLDYMDVFNWLLKEPTMLDDILTDITKKYAPEALEE